jgi:flagellar basal-body rod protein FlgC
MSMTINAITDAARAGLAYERLRMDAATRNIAAANVPLAPGAAASRASVGTTSAGFGDTINRPTLLSEVMATRLVSEPGSALADAHGMVRYPATDLVREMTTLMSASRGYEANVRAFNLLRGMVAKALEIGSR